MCQIRHFIGKQNIITIHFYNYIDLSCKKGYTTLLRSKSVAMFLKKYKPPGL